MKKFFKTIGASFYSSDLYKNAKEERVSQGIKLIVKTSLFLGIILGVIILIIFLIFSPILKKMAVSFFEKSYPNDLVVTIKDGNLTSNTTDPVVIALPVERKDNKVPKNLVVLVPNEKAEVSVLSKYDTIAAVTSNGIISIKNNNNVQEFTTYTYKNTNKVFTKDSTLASMNSLLRVFKIIIYISIIPMLVLFVLMMSFGNMIVMFLVALLIYLVMKIKKLNITYKQSYKIGLYAIVPLLILQIIAFPLHISGILFTSIVVLAIVLFVTRTWSKEKKKQS